MDFQFCYRASEGTFLLPRHIKERCEPLGFPDRCDTHRPDISVNFVMGLDGRASFRELKRPRWWPKQPKQGLGSSCPLAGNPGTGARTRCFVVS